MKVSGRAGVGVLGGAGGMRPGRATRAGGRTVPRERELSGPEV